MSLINMRKPLLLITILFSALISYGQNTGLHYIKFWHVGEKIMSVHTLNISFQDGDIPKDSDQILLDTLNNRYIVTDKETYSIISKYLNKTNIQLARDPGILSFGTFKIIEDGNYYYLPGLSCTSYFKNLVQYLKKKKRDPQVTQAIIENYPWIFNP
jgi:hypothetical protein